MTIDLTGKLVYNDDGKYELHTAEGIFCLTDILTEAYYSDVSNRVNLRIMEGSKILFQEDSNIYRKTNDYGIYSYYITGSDLETKLFDNTDKTVEVKLFAEAVEDYGQFYTTRKP